jgi:hypothetical protein
MICAARGTGTRFCGAAQYIVTDCRTRAFAPVLPVPQSLLDRRFSVRVLQFLAAITTVCSRALEFKSSLPETITIALESCQKLAQGK